MTPLPFGPSSSLRLAFSRRHRARGGWVKRVLLYGVAGLFALYLAGATAGFLFVRFVRKNENIGFMDVALLRWRDVRRGMAAQQFAKAKAEWDAGNLQVAFLAFTFAVNNDPDNIPGRLSAAQFLQTAGSVPMALTTLEAGLSRAPTDARLLERTFGLLVTTGRDRRVLELLRQQPASALSGPNGPMLRAFELEALLNLGEVAEAKKRAEQHPELATARRAQPVVARVLWESKERLRAIELLSSVVRSQPETSEPYVQLAQWQLSAEMAEDALRTAELAKSRFPDDPALRILVIEALGVRTSRGRDWVAAVGAYLQETQGRPEAIRRLAALAGRRGWVELARGLYELGALHEPDLSTLGFCYGDALMRRSRHREVQQLLAQIESQAPDANTSFMVQLRTRQVLAAAASGDKTAVRDFAQRLAGVLRNDPDTQEIVRRTFLKAGVAEAVAELSGRAPAPGVAARD